MVCLQDSTQWPRQFLTELASLQGPVQSPFWVCLFIVENVEDVRQVIPVSR